MGLWGSWVEFRAVLDELRPPIFRKRGPNLGTPQDCSVTGGWKIDPNRGTHRHRRRLRKSRRAPPYPMSKGLRLRHEVQNTEPRDRRKSDRYELHGEVGQKSTKNHVEILWCFPPPNFLVTQTTPPRGDCESQSESPATPGSLCSG